MDGGVDLSVRGPGFGVVGDGRSTGIIPVSSNNSQLMKQAINLISLYDIANIVVNMMTEEKNYEWSAEEWKRKLKQQAEDSREYRHRLYNKVGLKDARKILDVGCGTGVITLDIAENTTGEVTGIDIDENKLEDANKLLEGVPNAKAIYGDGTDIPFDDGSFDLAVFNIVLIHIKDQQGAVNEMARVVKKGGTVLASLEPDYDGVIQYPENPLIPLYHESVKKLGADLQTGRKLKYLFSKAGLQTTVGFDTESEFLLINDDKKRMETFLKNFWVSEKVFKENGWSDEQIETYKKEQKEQIGTGQSFYLMTAFYAIGVK